MIGSQTLEYNRAHAWNGGKRQSVRATAILVRLFLISRQADISVDWLTTFRIYAMELQRIFMMPAATSRVFVNTGNSYIFPRRDAAIQNATIAAVARPTLDCRVHEEAMGNNSCITHVQRKSIL
jgi:hypothetical protein